LEEEEWEYRECFLYSTTAVSRLLCHNVSQCNRLRSLWFLSDQSRGSSKCGLSASEPRRPTIGRATIEGPPMRRLAFVFVIDPPWYKTLSQGGRYKAKTLVHSLFTSHQTHNIPERQSPTSQHHDARSPPSKQPLQQQRLPERSVRGPLTTRHRSSPRGAQAITAILIARGFTQTPSIHRRRRRRKPPRTTRTGDESHPPPRRVLRDLRRRLPHPNRLHRLPDAPLAAVSPCAWPHRHLRLHACALLHCCVAPVLVVPSGGLGAVDVAGACVLYCDVCELE
jgi:hypothetical protein